MFPRGVYIKTILTMTALVMVVGCDNDDGGQEQALEDAGIIAPVDMNPDVFVVAEDASQASGGDAGELPVLDTIDFEPSHVRTPRLTQEQIQNALQDLFGDDLVVPNIAEPDLIIAGFKTVGAGISTLSQRGIESVERLAYSVAEQVVSQENRSRHLDCEVDQRDCVAETISQWGRHLWRRPISAEEASRLLDIYQVASDRLGDRWAGLEFVIAALVQSPHFLFVRSVGENGHYTSLEMASRLSFALWNTVPDEYLLDAGERGALVTDEGLSDAIDYLMESPRARKGFLRFFVQWLNLEELERLNKDPTVFPALSPELGEMAQTETLLNLEALIFDDRGDFRRFLTQETTHVNRKLASLYGIRAPQREGFGRVDLTRERGRRGFLGQTSFLAVNAHPVSTSATLRGKFVREKLLCFVIPPPPADVDTSIPEPSGRRQTLRDRVEEHLTDDACSHCHLLTDPIGLAFENFNGIGQWRDEDHGAEIDSSGDLDGTPFDDPWTLSGIVAEHPGYPRCTTIHLFRFLTGTLEEPEQIPMINALTTRFHRQGYRLDTLVREFLLSPAFRQLSTSEVMP